MSTVMIRLNVGDIDKKVIARAIRLALIEHRPWQREELPALSEHHRLFVELIICLFVLK